MKTARSLKAKLSKGVQNFWNDESGQGMTEYIFVLIILVAVLALFKDQIKEAFDSKIRQLVAEINKFTG